MRFNEYIEERKRKSPKFALIWEYKHNKMESSRVVAVSGHFNPLHAGHLELFRAAKELGDKLVVIVNSDYQVTLKRSKPFMSQSERLAMVGAIRYVDEALIAVDRDKTVCQTLSLLKPSVFANGGDQFQHTIPEVATCKRYHINMQFGVGGGKIQSSSNLKRSKETLTPWGKYEVLDRSKDFGYKIKLLTVNVGCRTSLQYHTKRCEHLIVVRGKALLTAKDIRGFVSSRSLINNEWAFIPANSLHRIENSGKVKLLISETQWGTCEEDDIIRVEDDYDRLSR